MLVTGFVISIASVAGDIFISCFPTVFVKAMSEGWIALLFCKGLEIVTGSDATEVIAVVVATVVEPAESKIDLVLDFCVPVRD